ncbi:MAG: SdpI family protein [Spirochaetales bacterium]|nr:SdpI family protein [Spirochaetales bacterium]
MYDVTIFIFFGIIETAIGAPFFFRKIPPNNIIGYKRILKQNDSELWYSVNKVFGQSMILSGITLIFLSVLLMVLFRNIDEEIKRIINTLILLILLASVIVRCEVTIRNKNI